jgi:hypothetical protein
MSRSHMLQVIGILFAGLCASTGIVNAVEKSVAAAEALPMLEAYYGLAPADRSFFRPAYYVIAKTGSLADMQAGLVVGGQHIAIPLRDDGRLLPLPTAQQLRDEASIVLKFPDGVRAGIRMKLEVSTPMSMEFKIEDLDRALTQASEGRRKVGGFLTFLSAPLARATFTGGVSGDIVYADGTRAPLALREGNPSYVLDKGKPARLILLRAMPRAVWLEEG